MKNKTKHSPTLETVTMVEKTIHKYSGEFKKTEIWNKLPKQMMWSTYLQALQHLEEVGKIAIAENGILVYIWNPSLIKKLQAKNDTPKKKL